MISDHLYPGTPREAFDAYLNRLLVADWEAGTGPMRFTPDLELCDLAGASFFLNARLFLEALEEAGGTATTATGNLNRVFVRQMFDRLIMPDRWRESILSVSKVLNEQDVRRLHLARVLCECAGLVARRQKAFHVTRAGRALLPDAAAGRLFHRLFLTYFRRFDLRYDFQMRDVPGIQQTIAVILWRLDNVARQWVGVRGLADQILLPGVLNQLHAAMVSPAENELWILGGYVLNPLVDLGLLERNPPSDRLFTEKDQVRTSPLWRKFIHFDHWSGGGQ